MQKEIQDTKTQRPSI